MKMRDLIRLVESTTYPEQASAHDIVQMVEKLHHTSRDFDDGDLENRIYRFSKYILKQIPISSLHLGEFYVDDERVADYKGRQAKSSPPIVFDSVARSIIDGTHRANAAHERGETAIWAYVGLPENQDPYWSENDGDEE